jgi:hypothetical protein
LAVLLRELLTGDTRQANNYRERLPDYNTAMAFVSMEAGSKLSPGNGPQSFRIYGQIYNLVSPLYPSEEDKPGYGQLYIFDSAEVTTKHLENQSYQGCIAEAMQ